MITLKKGNETKFIDEASSLMPLLIKFGWVEAKEKETKTKEKEAKNGISSTTGS